MAPYGYVCSTCDHPMALHRGRPGHSAIDGPYLCELCDCEVAQNAPAVGLNKAQFLEHERRAGR